MSRRGDFGCVARTYPVCLMRRIVNSYFRRKQPHFPLFLDETARFIEKGGDSRRSVQETVLHPMTELS
jgi:hypothetical protein